MSQYTKCNECDRILGSYTSKKKGLCFKCDYGSYSHIPQHHSVHKKKQGKNNTLKFQEQITKYLKKYESLDSITLHGLQTIYKNRATTARKLQQMKNLIWDYNQRGGIEWSIKQ